MKTLIYYLLLLIFVAIVTGCLIAWNGGAMSMQQMLTVSCLLVLYTIGMSLAGEGKVADEREQMHRYFSNRAALVSGTVILSIGILYQLFTHRLDYWLLVGLIVINLTKIISLIYLNYKR